MSDHSSISLQPTTVTSAAAKDVMPPPERLLTEPERLSFQKPSIQFKLSIGAPDDPLEHEADAMADRVMRMPDPYSKTQFNNKNGSVIQRKCSHCEEEEQLQRKPLKSFIQRKESSNCTVASDAISNKINASKGNGINMNSNIQTFMEGRFGTDFSEVKIHTGNESVQMNRELNAKAFTVGNDIYFNEGQYNPDSNEGKLLLAHELTHTVQQGIALRRKPDIIRRDALDDRAAREARAGDTQLRDALSDSVRNNLAFTFAHNFEGSSRINARQGGGIHVIIRSSFTNPTIVPQPANNTFIVTLMEEVIGFDIPHGAVRFVVGIPGSYSWTGLNAGSYYLKFEKNSSEEISGTVWVDNLSGPGEVAVANSASDQFEMATGYDPAANHTTGVAYGQFALRSEPIRNSFIFGTLPGIPTHITVIDKRSFSRVRTEDNPSYYKIQFANSNEFRRLATRIPPEPLSLAMQMYNSNQAWVTEDALKVYIPYNLLLLQIQSFEAQPAVAAMTVSQRITYLRQLHQDPELPYDTIIGTPSGARSVSDRPELSNLMQMLKEPATGIIAPDGSLLDFAHILITMDAYQHPDVATTYSPTILFPTQPIGSSRAVMSWSGDVGGAVGDYTIAHEDSGLTALNAALLDKHFAKSAPDPDLLGNLDGVGASTLLNTSRITSLAGLLRLYYEGITPTNLISNPNTVNAHRAAAITSFLSSYGFNSPTGLTAPSHARSCILYDAGMFGLIWYRRGRGLSYAQLTVPVQVLISATVEMSDRFLRRMEYFAGLYGVTTIPASSVRSATCSTPAVPTSVAPIIPPATGVVPPIRRKKETNNLIKKSEGTQFTQIDQILTHIGLQIQMQNGGAAAPRLPLRSVIFRNNTRIVNAYNSGSLLLSRTSGSTESITLIQQSLLYLYPTGPVRATSGLYGDQTVSAVEQFQQNVMHMSTPTGQVDSATLLAIDTAIANMESSGPDAATSATGTLPTRFADYPATYISQIEVDLSTQTILLTWTGPSATSRNRGPFECSTGRGIIDSEVCYNCDDITVSGTSGSNCTPKGSFTIASLASSLPSYPEALFVSYFDVPRGVAFHYYPSVPRSPASHGCVRLHLYPAILVHANIVTGRTTVNVMGTWSRSWRDTVLCLQLDAEDWLRDRRRDAGNLWDRATEW